MQGELRVGPAGPEERRPARAGRSACVVNDWQLSGIWTGATGCAYTVGFSYQNGGGNVNLTGSPDYGARVRLVGDPGEGCSSNPYSQFNTGGVPGTALNSVGLESGNDYLRGCFTSVLDLAIARNIRLGGGRNIQLRVDMFNAPNPAIITGRNTTMNLASPTIRSRSPTCRTMPNGDLMPTAFAAERGAGFGVGDRLPGAADDSVTGALLVLRDREARGHGEELEITEKNLSKWTPRAAGGAGPRRGGGAPRL